LANPSHPHLFHAIIPELKKLINSFLKIVQRDVLDIVGVLILIDKMLTGMLKNERRQK